MSAPFEIDAAPWAALDPGPVTPARLVYAAAHVVMRDDYASAAHADDPAVIAAHVDWASTTDFRRHLARHGFGIAEAMDTAQRFRIGWPTARELIRRCGALGLETGFVAGASTDQLSGTPSRTALVDAVVEQIGFIQSCGGIAMILPLPALAHEKAAPDEYVEVYRAIIDQVEGPLFLHWLGAMFLPGLEGYFPGDSFDRVMDIDPAKVRGVKLSLLDAAFERETRDRRHDRGQIVLTGDDLSFADLIAGDEPAATGVTTIGGRAVPTGCFSHALLGIFDGIAAPAAIALRCLAAGRLEDYRRIMVPCQELSRLVFAAPTQHYKVGLAFLSWLNGHQDNRLLVGREELERTKEHLWSVARLAAAAGALTDAEVARERLVRL